MKSGLIRWLGIALIVEVGLLHFYYAPEVAIDAPFLSILFIANFIATLVTAYGIYNNRRWGWVLGLIITSSSVIGYIVSRTVGLPGMDIESWANPIGIVSLVIEAVFIILVALRAVFSRISLSKEQSAPIIPTTSTPNRTHFLLPLSAFLLVTGVSFAAFQLDANQAEFNKWYADMSGYSESNLTLISNQTLADQYGLQVSQIALTMQGSIVDIRFKILDGDKARTVFQNHNTMPMLMLIGQPGPMIMPARMHKMSVKTGGTLVIFYPNLQNVIRSGSVVSMMIDNQQIEPIVAR